MENKVQQKLVFELPHAPQTISFAIEGTTIYANPSDGNMQRAHLYLTAARIEAELISDGSLVFPLKSFHRVTSISHSVKQIYDDILTKFIMLIQAYQDGVQVFEVDKFSDSELSIAYNRYDVLESVVLHADYEHLLLVIDVPLVYSRRASRLVDAHRKVPLVLGHAQMSLDDYIEIETKVPQMLERSGIPYLFKVTATKYGVPTNQLEYLQNSKGIVIANRGISPRRQEVKTFDNNLSHLGILVDELTGMLAKLNARPYLIVEGDNASRLALLLLSLVRTTSTVHITTHPENIWLWYSYASYLNVSVGPQESQARVIITTYDQLMTAGRHEYRCVIYDTPTPSHLVHADPLKGMLNCQKLALVRCGASLAERLQAAALVRSVEFKEHLRNASTTEQNSDSLLRAHIDMYTYIFSYSLQAQTLLPSLTNQAVELSEQQMSVVNRLLSTKADLLDVTRYLDVGTASSLSPKVSKTLEIVHDYALKQIPLTVIASSAETVTMLKKLIHRNKTPNSIVRIVSLVSQAETNSILYYDAGINLPALRGKLKQGYSIRYVRTNSTYADALDILSLRKAGTVNPSRSLATDEIEYVRNYCDDY